MGWPKALQDDDAAATRSEVILSGPKQPTWACKQCHVKGNLANWIRCRCHAPAPADVVAKAKQRHEKARATGGTAGSSSWGSWGTGRVVPHKARPTTPSAKSKKEISLEAENLRLKQELEASKGTGESGGVHGPHR